MAATGAVIGLARDGSMRVVASSMSRSPGSEGGAGGATAGGGCTTGTCGAGCCACACCACGAGRPYSACGPWGTGGPIGKPP
jgi:hypothetical protein